MTTEEQQTDAALDLLGCAETLIDLVDDGHSASDLRQYISVALRAAIEEYKRTRE